VKNRSTSSAGSSASVLQSRGGDGGAERDVPAHAVADRRHRASEAGPEFDQHRYEVGDMSLEADHPGLAGALVAPSVVGHHVELGQAAHDPAETLGPIQ
jgi:hypothetical protein